MSIIHWNNGIGFNYTLGQFFSHMPCAVLYILKI